jgi:integrase
VSARVEAVDAAGEHRDGQTVAREGGTVRHPVDAVGSLAHLGVLLAFAFPILNTEAMHTNPPRHEWFLYRRVDTTVSDAMAPRRADTYLKSAHTADLGRPLFVDESGHPHIALNLFFKSATSAARADSTNWRYAHSIRVWLNFLALRDQTWDAATEQDRLDFKFWRRSDVNNPSRIAGSSWHSDVAAYDLFYRWARQRGFLTSQLSLVGEGAGWVEVSSLRFSTNKIRSSDVKWLTPGAFRRWRDIGVLGHDRQGSELQRWRPRSEQRDQAFIDGLYGTGLRIREWSSVLSLELPKLTAASAGVPDAAVNRKYRSVRLSNACAKRGLGRKYRIKTVELGLIENYSTHDRARAVRAGQASGLYDSASAWMVVEETSADGIVISSNGRTVEMTLDDVDPETRRRLLLRTPEGLEPAQLWLNEDGAPRAKHAWYRTFQAANKRVARTGIDGLICRPHMLRHSFALRWYAMARMAWEGKLKHLGIREREDFREQFGDTWYVIQGLLGHMNVETTRNVYLEPFRSLSTDLLLEQIEDDADAADYLLMVLREDPRVLHDDWKVG